MTMAISPSPSREFPKHQPLGVDSRLRFDAGACLPVRFPGTACGICVDACPVAAIELNGHVPMANGEACIGCGQCVTVCPTAALNTDGFALPPQIQTDAEALHIDCWRVALGNSPPGALRIPCLGGVGAGWLLSLFDRLDEEGLRPIRLLDRGACAGCPAGPGMEAFHAMLDEVRTLLADCGIEDAVLPAPTFLPARQPLTPTIPTAASAQPMGRRGFLRGLIGSTARTLDAAKAAAIEETDIVLRREVLPVENMRIATALANIARRRGRAVPIRPMPQLTTAGCDAHGVCAKVCPTGALQQQDFADGTGAELHFNAALCITCGQCVRICPDRALRLSPHGGQMGSEILVRWSARDCDTCGESFFGSSGNTCPSCRKEQSLFESAADLFG